MIKIDKLCIGDIVGTTSIMPQAEIIKARTWGWKYILDQSKCNHTATVIDRGHGLLYLAEMVANGLVLSDIHKYDHRSPMQHICFIGRHPELSPLSDSGRIKQAAYNEFILELHAKKVKYGWDDIANYIPYVHFHDNPDTLICPELPRDALKHVGISYPESWDSGVSPADMQKWDKLINVTKEVIA